MSANIIFDNIYVGDDENAAFNFAQQTFKVKVAQVLHSYKIMFVKEFEEIASVGGPFLNLGLL